ncbi:MAG: class I SAM-dependent methyltransferase, partial [Pseudomonadales bacterium]|nr:class I SAM-dependent methyltransferase [Pseudomonadales bacterium]
MIYENLLREGIEQLPLELSEEKIRALLAYHQLLQDWNKAYNLTAVRKPEQMIIRHLLD